MMFIPRLLLIAVVFVLAACNTMNDAQVQAQLDARNSQIAQEPPGDYFVGRRFRIDRTHFWGYLRKAREPWSKSKLVIFSEDRARQPDRLPEQPGGSSPAYGFDHNSEYRIWGSFTGRRIYDPNSDLALPEFMLSRYQLVNASPGWLFMPNERFNGYQLLRNEPGTTP